VPLLICEPGFGNSSARKVAEDYAQENINIAMLEVLKHTGRDKAVWIGRLSLSLFLRRTPKANNHRSRLGLWLCLDFRRPLP
jgi:hypothetical protein